MPTTIEKSALLTLADAAASVAKAKGLSPITQLVTLSASDNRLTAKATDWESWLSRSEPCDGDMDMVQTDAAKFREVVAGMAGTLIKLEVKDGWLHLSAKGGSKRKIAGQSIPLDLVKPPKGQSITIDRAILADALVFVKDNICKDGARLYINGVHFHGVDGKLRLVSVSGNSCSCITMCDFDGDLHTAVGDRIVSLIKHVPEGDLTVTFGGEKAMIEWDGGSVIFPMNDTKFADYTRAIAVHDNALLVRGDHFMNRVNAIAAVAAGENGSKRVTLALGDDVGVYGASQSGVEGSDPLDAQWSGDAGEIAFNATTMAWCVNPFGSAELEMGITPVEFDSDGNPLAPKVIMIRAVGDDSRFAYLAAMKTAK